MNSSGGNSLFPVGAKPSKFPTKLSNFRQTIPFALEKAVFSPFIGQNFRKFVIFHEGGGGRPPPHPTEISATGEQTLLSTKRARERLWVGWRFLVLVTWIFHRFVERPLIGQCFIWIIYDKWTFCWCHQVYDQQTFQYLCKTVIKWLLLKHDWIDETKWALRNVRSKYFLETVL